MSLDRGLLRQGFVSGLRKGLDGFIWMMKIVVPISFLTAFLAWSGWIDRADFLIAPVMAFLGLPAVAALPIAIGVLMNIYGGIAAMAVLPLTADQMTLIAIFLLIAHNMIQEGIIQAKSGISPLKATVFRLAAATATVLIAGLFFDAATAAPLSPGIEHATQPPFAGMLWDWGTSMLSLGVKIFFIIMAILTLLEITKTMGWIDAIVKLLQPFLRLMGLSRQVGILWMTAVVFGLAYGGAVIVEEAKAGHLTKDELEELHLSIGINHSMIEDPSLFLTFGLSPFWLWVPRLITAIIATRLLTLWVMFRSGRTA